MECSIIGREYEKQLLNKLFNSNKPEFLAIYGRRRVGKTYLISEFFEDKGIYFEITGSKNSSMATHIARFCIELSSKFYNGKKNINAETWEQAFRELKIGIDRTVHENPQQRIIIFFDELPWIDKTSKGFLGSLDYYWNRYFSKTKYKNILLIICGSAASWIICHVINSKGGLHNRITRTIRLLPFTLEETNAYLKANNIIMEKKQLIEIYMAIGGVPFYLSHIEKGLSAVQQINNLCFKKDAVLQNEFDRLFQSLFDNHQMHLSVVQSLASVKKGLTRNELLQRAKLHNSGDSTMVLRELEEAGFIYKNPAFGKKIKDSIYRLYDEYSLFYINWIAPVRSKMIQSSDYNYWMQKCNTAAWKAWSGYAFEGICLKHIEKIKHALGISGILTYQSAWYYHPPSGSNEKGAQIDLVIERADNTINLIEIKYANDEFVITKDYQKELAYKKRLFQRITRTKNHIFQTFISTYGVKENDYYIATVDNQLTLESLF